MGMPARAVETTQETHASCCAIAAAMAHRQTSLVLVHWPRVLEVPAVAAATTLAKSARRICVRMSIAVYTERASWVHAHATGATAAHSARSTTFASTSTVDPTAVVTEVGASARTRISAMRAS